ncbi:MAG: hypothetical protein ABW098_08725 [Candidatus Thiodiazotropha sp.]
MNIKRPSFLVALALLMVPLWATADKITGSFVGQMPPVNLEDTLVIVDKIMGIDDQGNHHVLYNEANGRVYRLRNIEQAIHDLSARGIASKGSFRSLQAVLNDTVYLMGENRIPYPAQRSVTQIPQAVKLSVEKLRVTKDRIIAIYTTNCSHGAI